MHSLEPARSALRPSPGADGSPALVNGFPNQKWLLRNPQTILFFTIGSGKSVRIREIRVRIFVPLALQSPGIIVRREDFSRARTALSACFRRIGAFARTKLSALLWLRLRRAMSLR
jgi:hypothetical protein